MYYDTSRAIGHPDEAVECEGLRATRDDPDASEQEREDARRELRVWHGITEDDQCAE